MGTKQYHPTPPQILPFLADLMERAHTAMLDPCAGDGATLDYLARKWSCSRYAAEVDRTHFEILTKIAKAKNERFEDLYVKNFTLAYVYPPPYMRNPISWLRHVYRAMYENGIVIWRMTKKVLQRPQVIEVFTELFYNWELFRDPPGVWDSGNHYTIRCKAKKADETGISNIECFEFAQAIEEAGVLGETIVAEWDTPRGRGIQFRERGLEWEDVYPEMLDALAEIRIPKTHESIAFKQIERWHKAAEEGKEPEIEDPRLVNSGRGQCWTAGYAMADSKLHMFSLVGRKTAIYAIESEFRRGRMIKFGYYSGKVIGGVTGAKEDYHVIKTMLPNTGAFIHVWVHKSCTRDADAGRVFILDNEEAGLAAKMVSNALGIPVAPEWMDIVNSKCGYVSAGRSWNIDGRFLNVHREVVMRELGNRARGGNLPEPSPTIPETIRPIMPPSVGIWAQFAMQEFINEIPLTGNIMMHAKPIVIKDVDTEEAIDGRVERTTIERKDAVRITVFHYAGDRAGEWEVFETERMDDSNGSTTGPNSNPPANTPNQPGGHTVAAVDLAEQLSRP